MCDVAPRSLDPEAAALYVGGRQLLSEYLAAQWLRPYVRRKRLTRYDVRDLDLCVDRHKLQEPVPLHGDN